MQSTEIWLTPYGGLANRMMAINSTVEFASENGIELNVVWFSNHEINARFSSLFLPLPYARSNVKEAGFFYRFLYRSPRRNNLWLTSLTPKFCFDSFIYHPEFSNLKKSDSLKKTLLSRGKVLIESCYDFGDYSSALARNFKPVWRLQVNIDKYVESNFADRTIGVHIRRTDNVLSINRSPIELFIVAMQNEIDAHPEVKFFVASDDPKEKDLLKKRFGRRVIARNSECSRTNQRGIETAVEDMYLLSRTSKIYGSFYSTFSCIAATLTGIDIVILANEENKR